MTTEYPPSRLASHVDLYHGVRVSDPFRWLEETPSPEVASWIAAQNAVTAEYLAPIAVRQAIRQRFEQLLCYARYYDFIRRGDMLFFKKNDGLRNQLPVYVQRGWDNDAELLIDPTVVTPDGTTSVSTIAPSRDGRYLAYGLAFGGTGWQEYFIKDLATGTDLPDHLRWIKLSRIAWCGDGFFYSRFPEPPSADAALSARNEHHQLWYHCVGTPQSADTLTYYDPTHPQHLVVAETTADERFLVLLVKDGADDHPGFAVRVRDAADATGELRPLIDTFESQFVPVDSDDGRLIFRTNRGAPNWRLVAIDPAAPEECHWTEIIPEQPDPLESVVAAGGRFAATYRRDASARLYIVSRSGELEYEVPLPDLGDVNLVRGHRDDSDLIWGFTSFTAPRTLYRYDFVSRTSALLRQPAMPFDVERYATHHVSYASKDGTRVPMFVIHRRYLNRDGQNPLLLTGYGGNGVTVVPSFDPFVIALLERGFVYAVAGLRGGGEYGEAWHDAGRRERKQNVFDDCIAAAEYLHAEGYATPERSALIGGSNGGLLVGAVMTQRPDLFRVAIPIAGIMDMLRFQQYTLGWAWAGEYGTSDDPAMFRTLLSYSPLHNVKPGVEYPATLVAAYDNDDCVVPSHSYKFVATLQALGAGPNPYLIRIETNSGHGPVNLRKTIDERADLYAFIVAHVMSATSAD